jgi:hypothetical protein
MNSHIYEMQTCNSKKHSSPGKTNYERQTQNNLEHLFHFGSNLRGLNRYTLFEILLRVRSPRRQRTDGDQRGIVLQLKPKLLVNTAPSTPGNAPLQ